ncbi:MAG: nucleotidyltransferase family protein [Gammaproteobacteria bacterium]|nr:nucleotidyltransferase family protein [Gammaproteobacteria bacterium]
MKAMILAAGRGERMRPLTDHTPKPLLEVGKYSLIEHLVRSLVESGFVRLIVNHAHLGNQIEARLGTGAQFGATIEYSAEGETGLETGGGIYKALPLLGDAPFLVVNGDIWTDYPFSRMHNMVPAGMAHLVMVDNPPQHPAGDFVLHDNSAISNDLDGRLTYSGIGVYRPEMFAGCQPGKFPLAPILRKLADESRLTGEYFPGNWSDVGTPERLQVLRDQCG